MLFGLLVGVWALSFVCTFSAAMTGDLGEYSVKTQVASILLPPVIFAILIRKAWGWIKNSILANHYQTELDVRKFERRSYFLFSGCLCGDRDWQCGAADCKDTLRR